MDVAIEVVVVAYGAPELLDSCLASLDGAFPVVVVDNSSDLAVQQVSERRRARYVDPGANLGFAAGVNVGIGRLPPETSSVLLLNPDACIDPGGVVELHRRLHASPRLACVAPAQVDPASGIPARVAWPFPTPRGAWVEAVGLGRLRRAEEFLIGSVLMVRAEALDDVGPFDPRFFLYAEETDWQRRAASRGWGVALCREVVATHMGAGTGGDRQEREIHFQASHERYIRKHFGMRGWRIYRAAVMAGAAARAVILPGDRGRGAASRLRCYLSGPVRMEDQLDGERQEQ